MEIQVIKKTKFRNSYIYSLKANENFKIQTNLLLKKGEYKWKISGVVFESIQEKENQFIFDCTLSCDNEEIYPNIGDILLIDK